MVFHWSFERKSTLHRHTATNGGTHVLIMHNHLVQDVPAEAEGYIPHVTLRVTRNFRGKRQEFTLIRKGHPDENKGEFTSHVKTFDPTREKDDGYKPRTRKLTARDAEYVKQVFTDAISNPPLNGSATHKEVRLFNPAVSLVKQRILAKL